tara:strand:+ start:256 stop:597 length:342 start_codon:yes stop_codon:yes gene_type:complete
MMNKKHLTYFLLLLTILFTSSCVSSQRVSGKRYNFFSPGNLIGAPELLGLYTYEEDYTSIKMIQNPKDFVFYSAHQPNVGFGNFASSGSIGSVKTVEGKRHRLLFGLIDIKTE